jgi:hypothetical protein
MTRVRIALAAIVTTIWAAGYINAYIGRGQTPEELSGLMGIVLGWALAGEVKDSLRRWLQKGGDDEKRD